MFDFVRNHSRLVLGIMVLLIFPSFIFFGIQGYTRFTDNANTTVAKVDGQAITRAEWELAHQRNIERLRQQRPDLDARLLGTPQLRRETLEGLVRERVLFAAANDLKLFPGRERMARLFDADPQFAGLRDPDGKINRDLLAAQGLTPAMFDEQLRQRFGLQQVLGAVGQSTFTPLAVAAPSLDARLQRREIQLQRFDPAAYRDKVNPTDADIEAYYKANEAQFRAPEQATIEYVALTLDALAKDTAVPEAEVRKFYDENAARFTRTEERRASHILVKVDPKASAAEKQAAKARAEELLAQVRKNPASFADVARKNSQDPGSAPQGGDLDFFGRGMMAKPFEDTVFSMKQGEISDVVETDFGYHIITVTGIRGGDRKPYEQVRGEIEAELRRAAAQKKYAEAAEQFTNTVYEQPDSLQPVIDKLKLQKQTATVQRQPLPGATGPLASQKLLDAVFGSDAVKNKRNTDAVEVAPNQLASARIVQYTPARTLPLAEVKQRVRERLVAVQAATLARADGEKRLAELKKAPTETLPQTLVVSRINPQGQAPQVVDAVLRADASKLPQAVGVDLGDLGYVVARVTQILPRDEVPGGDATLQQQYAQTWGNAETVAYMDALKKRYKVEIKEAAVAEANAGAASAPGL
jgi:peptidyl-prolyl cis-trans isomerase D